MHKIYTRIFKCPLLYYLIINVKLEIFKAIYFDTAR